MRTLVGLLKVYTAIRERALASNRFWRIASENSSARACELLGYVNFFVRRMLSVARSETYGIFVCDASVRNESLAFLK